MDNALLELEKAYGKAKFDGHGVHVHKVPHDTDTLGHDRYREGIYPVESSMIAKPRTMSSELKQEYRSLISHCSSDLYRVEFQRCRAVNCTLCSQHIARECPLNDFMDRFPHNRIPMPIPSFPVFPPDMFLQRWYQDAEWSDNRTESNPKLEGLMVPRKPGSAQPSDRIAGHFRTFGDLLTSPLPKNCHIYSTDYYKGSSRRIRCSKCRLPHYIRSDAAYKRHHITLHGGVPDKVSDPQEKDADTDESEVSEA